MCIRTSIAPAYSKLCESSKEARPRERQNLSSIFRTRDRRRSLTIEDRVIRGKRPVLRDTSDPLGLRQFSCVKGAVKTLAVSPAATSSSETMRLKPGEEKRKKGKTCRWKTGYSVAKSSEHSTRFEIIFGGQNQTRRHSSICPASSELSRLQPLGSMQTEPRSQASSLN